jgi:hypothetical protein
MRGDRSGSAMLENNNEQKNLNSFATPTKSIYYSFMRGDRSGSAMLDMLSNNTGYKNNNEQKNQTISLAQGSTLALVNSSDTPTKSIYYSCMRGDRSGSAMLDMIFCHGYCFQNNFTYGGAVTNPEEDKLMHLLIKNCSKKLA